MYSELQNYWHRNIFREKRASQTVYKSVFIAFSTAMYASFSRITEYYKRITVFPVDKKNNNLQNDVYNFQLTKILARVGKHLITVEFINVFEIEY